MLFSHLNSQLYRNTFKLYQDEVYNIMW